jgi:chromosome segregation protein
MFLKSLSMKGFKSFADPTVLEFEPGITVVVGPNGSGKSNVVDAVTWVLGAQGPRALRSQKMEDVIFAGTNSRPALGRAEVSLTIDNESGKLPVDMAEVTITRTLFRSGDSEYAINGAPCRLLDIQELLSDSGVGRQQHMIIGQGQLDAVLNARPEDRRAIVEEAAGVLKHRRRRERAERRLAATQENLERLGDLVREVRRQIRPLERQAAAARSHGALTAELRAVRLHLAGSELDGLAARRTAVTEALARLTVDERELRESVAALDEQATAAAAALSSSREVDLASALGRVQGLVERARGTTGVLRERARSLASALDAAADVDVVSNLEAEGARLAAELVAAEEESNGLSPEEAELEASSRQLAADEAEHRETWGEGSEVQEAEESLSRARTRVELLRRALEQDRRALADLDQRVATLQRREQEAADADGALAERAAGLEREAQRLAAEAAAAESADVEMRRRADETERAAHAAEQSRHRSAARAEALARALHELEGAGGREALAGVSGVVGSLVDLVQIDAGWEAAFEAAAGASVSAVVVDGRSAVREALSRLHTEGATGALLAAGGNGGSTPAGDLEHVAPGAEALRPHVQARGGGPGVDQVLDALLGRAVRVPGWEEAVDLALDRPDLVVVTGDGDRFADSGWRVRSTRGVVTAAAVEEAHRRAEAAATEADRAAEQLAGVRQESESARTAAVTAGRAADRHEAARAAVTAERSSITDERERLAQELMDTGRARVEASEQIEADGRDLAELESSLPALEVAASEAGERAAQASAAAQALEDRREALGALRHQLEVRAAGIAERRRVLAGRRAEVERRLEGHAEERQAAAERRRRLEADGVAIRRLEELVDGERVRLESLLTAVRDEYRHQVEEVRAGGERLESLRQERATADARLTTLGERRRALDVEATEVTLRAETLSETVERELDAGADEARLAPLPEIPEGTTPAKHAAHLAEELASLGPVNPLALEELGALEERHRELDTQVADVRSARRELQDVVRALDEEIVQSFAAAAADVNEHFSALVAMLFPGGVGRLSLTEPENLLDTGVEIEVRPAGRNVRRVSLLSGGERSLAALAFLFAVFRSRPSPFYLMDEVEAALDDVNLHRFLGLVREFRDEAQLIIVSHQKRTMETGDALYGVTMAPGGSSQVVSQKMAEEKETPPPASSPSPAPAPS